MTKFNVGDVRHDSMHIYLIVDIMCYPDDDDDVFALNAEDVTRGRGVGGGVVHVDFPVAPPLHFLPGRAEAAGMCQPLKFALFNF